MKKRVFLFFAFFIYFFLFYMCSHEIRLLLSIVACISVVFNGIYIIYNLYQYEQVREFFWNNLDDKDKYCINYIFHRSGFTKDSPGLPIGRDEVEFQEKRNIIILKCNKEKGNLLISLEKSLCYLEILMIILIAITALSFDYA